MIAKEIENAVRHLGSLKYKVEPETWKSVRGAMADLTDIAARVRALENRQRLAPGLSVVEMFSEPDAEGRAAVNLARVGHLLGDIGQALRDQVRRTPRPLRRKPLARDGRKPGLSLVAETGSGPRPLLMTRAPETGPRLETGLRMVPENGGQS